MGCFKYIFEIELQCKYNKTINALLLILVNSVNFELPTIKIVACGKLLQYFCRSNDNKKVIIWI